MKTQNSKLEYCEKV